MRAGIVVLVLIIASSAFAFTPSALSHPSLCNIPNLCRQSLLRSFHRYFNRPTNIRSALYEKKWYDTEEELTPLEFEFESESEETIIDENHPLKPGNQFNSVFYLDEDNKSIDTSQADIASMSLWDISQTYQYSIAYLADFVCQLGYRPPVDVDIKLKDMLTGSQVYSLLHAILSQAAIDVNMDYMDSITAKMLIDELGMNTDKFIRICEYENFHLPFGLNTVLHAAMEKKIREVHKYQGSEDFEDIYDEKDIGEESQPSDDELDELFKS